MIKLELTLRTTPDRYSERIRGTVIQVRPTYVKIAADDAVECVPYSKVASCVATCMQRDYTCDVHPSDIRDFLTRNLEDSLTMYDSPMPVRPAAPRPSTPVIPQAGPARIAAMEAALADEVAKQNKAELIAIKRQAVAADLALVNAQGTLLQCIDMMLKGQPYTQPVANLAEHAKALKPMAEAHGFKVVLIGDKSLATVVAA